MTTTTTALPTITHEQLQNGKHRYYVDGEVHTKGATRLYTHASVYDTTADPTIGDRVIFLHARADLAAKGSPDANRICDTEYAWRRIPGIVEIMPA